MPELLPPLTNTSVPSTQFRLVREVLLSWVSGTRGKYPMSKVPIFASFDFAEILMLTASILVVAAITFVF
jgi:hypothetical protein